MSFNWVAYKIMVEWLFMEHAHHTTVYTTEENISPFPRSHQLPINSQRNGGALWVSHPFQKRMLIGPAWCQSSSCNSIGYDVKSVTPTSCLTENIVHHLWLLVVSLFSLPWCVLWVVEWVVSACHAWLIPQFSLRPSTLHSCRPLRWLLTTRVSQAGAGSMHPALQSLPWQVFGSIRSVLSLYLRF